MIDHSELLPEGREIGGFRIDKAIGHGNMGIIYRAIQVNLNRPVALKVLFKTVAEDQDFVRSFFREAQAAAAFTHQNIVQAFDVGQSDDGIYYFAMELIDGGDISLQLENAGIYDPITALEKMLGVADGLDYGSTLRKLTHGDIKPANIMITKNGTFKLADLGLARMGGEIQGESDGIMLTPLYAAPEMINGTWNVGDPRADMYSLGATLYQMMYGEPPFYDDDYQNVIKMQLSQQHIPLKDLIENFPTNISKLVDKFLEKDQDDRFETWGEAKLAIETTLKDPTGSHSKKKKKKIHYHHHKEDELDPESSHSHSGSSSRSHRKKKNSSAPILISIIALVVIAGLGYFALNMKKDVIGNDYKTLKARFEGKKPEAIIKLIENFIERHGATPMEAEKDLKKYIKEIDERSLFSVNDLSYQTDKIEQFEKQFRQKNPVVTENFRFNLSKIESGLNANLDTNNLIFHLPFNNSVSNHADFFSPPKISVKYGNIAYSTAQVDKGIDFDGQSIIYGDLSRLRFSNNGSFTISFWINPKLSDFPILGKIELSSTRTIYKGYLISLVNGRLQADFYENADESKLSLKTTKELSQSNWNHVVLQYNGEDLSIHLNGMKADTEVLAQSLNGDFACTGPFVVGFKNMKAVLDDVRIWSKTLTDKELKELNNYRSISDLERLTGRYQDIKSKIRGASFNLNNPVPDDDISPPAKAAISHPEYDEFKKNLQLLKDDPSNWRSISNSIQKNCKALSSDLAGDDKIYFKSIAAHIKTARLNFYSSIINDSNLKGLDISDGDLKDYKITRIEAKLISLKENSPRLGFVTHRYFRTEARTNQALNGIISTMLDNNLFKDETPSAYIFAMVIGNKYHYKKLAKLKRFPVIMNGLNRDLGN